MHQEKRSELVRNFSLRNIAVEYFDNLGEVKERIEELIPIECSVGIGHSKTLEEMELSFSLSKRGNIVYDKTKAKTKEESVMLKKKALLTDWYVSGSNAVSIDGRIVNIDHSGNRVAAMIYGPDNVIIVVGKNKIVNNVDEAIERVKSISAPLNAKRAGFNPPCVELRKCIDCKSNERVCNSLVIIKAQSAKDRMRLFIVNEEYGF